MKKEKLAPCTKVNLKKESTISEYDVQEYIAKYTDSLNLGDLTAKREVSLVGYGRVDLVLQSCNESTQYAVEIQLGDLDADHLVRTVTYQSLLAQKDTEHEYVAVIVAENIIKSKSYIALELLSRTTPIIAYEMLPLKFEGADKTAIHFHKVLDTYNIGDDVKIEEDKDRNFWLSREDKKTTENAMAVVDSIYNKFVTAIDKEYKLSYLKSYINLVKDGTTMNFVSFIPRMKYTTFYVKCKQTQERNKKIEETKFGELKNYYAKGEYRFNLCEEDVETHKELIKYFVEESYNENND